MIVKQLSGVGTRQINEDALGYTVCDGVLCAVVCDGLGGHDAGEVASRIVRDSLLKDFNESPSMDETVIGQYIWNAQNALVDEKEDNLKYKDMLTTLTLLITDGSKIVTAHVGDSRILLYNKHKLAYKTKDHSVVGAMVENGEITEREALHHPDRNKLVRVMGMQWESKKYEIKTIDREGADIDYAVLCSDGFWENYHSKKLGWTIRLAKDYDHMFENIELKIAKSKFYGDNYSALLIVFD